MCLLGKHVVYSIAITKNTSVEHYNDPSYRVVLIVVNYKFISITSIKKNSTVKNHMFAKGVLRPENYAFRSIVKTLIFSSCLYYGT